ncbi:RuBisCO operon transcriptional regulator protein [Indibacter alkaliphilus LW1]|uniref:RuBisCO operon transcriptional regulator protein n=1 Tax=Indibacter alkaliphilus (strain CCUG 57479 / KCTC 22604 / LW1) TaxID=1189612 RepID=S2DBN5_INDAL|nr:LysR family transcriptional regulator [Indibacter alkaliphilus]EOZ96354.1 RuBisCO operon transcriptional regulator protein [Indibacter alkaliphilus LW1]
MNYTLHQLQVFQKIVETGSITKAAEELHLTQPAVSIQLRNFQDQFDIPLTEVLGRKIHVTEFGYEIAELAENILTQVQAINGKTMAFKGQLTGRLKIAVVSTGKYVMPYFLTDFLKKHPSVELKMDVTNKNKVLETLEQNEIDLALVSILPPGINLEYQDLLDNNLYLVGSSAMEVNSHVKHEEIFKEFPLIFRESGSGTRKTMEKFIEGNKISIQKKMELTSNEAVKQAVLAGLGFSIMPLIGIKNELQTKQLKIIPVKGLPITTKWRLVWLKGKKHMPLPLAYLEFLKENKEDIVKKFFSDMGGKED